MALAQEAFRYATQDPARTARYVSLTFDSDAEVIAYGALHMMALYAERVDVAFQAYMRQLFGKKFKKAPVKKVKRMLTKLRQDLEEDFHDGKELALAWDDAEASAARGRGAKSHWASAAAGARGAPGQGSRYSTGRHGHASGPSWAP